MKRRTANKCIPALFGLLATGTMVATEEIVGVKGERYYPTKEEVDVIFKFISNINNSRKTYSPNGWTKKEIISMKKHLNSGIWVNAGDTKGAFGCRVYRKGTKIRFVS